MKILEEIKEKYVGKIKTTKSKSISTPWGQFKYDEGSIKIQISNIECIVGINSSSGANYISNPFYITAELNDSLNKNDYLIIYPNSFFDNISSIFRGSRKSIKKGNYRFEGSETLLISFAKNKEFIESIKSINLAIYINHKNNGLIILTPLRGVESIEEFDDFLSILNKIKNLTEFNKV